MARDDEEDDDGDGDDERGATATADGQPGPSRVAKTERILNLIAVLLRAEGPVPVTEILGKVTGYNDKATRDSLMRRFERDKKVLRDMGVPIEHAMAGPFGVEGYTIAREAFFLDEVRLPAESGQLLRALFAWAHAGGGELSADLRAALVKLGYFVDDASPGAPAQAREELDPAPRARRGTALDPKLASGPVVGMNLERLSEAVMRQRTVKLKYYTISRNEELTRDVDPYGLGFAGQAWNRGAWYLVGWCHVKKALRVFKVQRIRGEVKLLRTEGDAPDFQIPAGFRVRDHIGRTRWEYQDLASAFDGAEAARPCTARVRFEAAVAPEVRSHVPSARVVAQDASWETLEFDVQRRRPFARFLLRYVPRIVIEAPADLDADVRAMARQVLARYGATSPSAASAGAPAASPTSSSASASPTVSP